VISLALAQHARAFSCEQRLQAWPHGALLALAPPARASSCERLQGRRHSALLACLRGMRAPRLGL